MSKAWIFKLNPGIENSESHLCLQNVTGAFVFNLVDVSDFWTNIILMEIARSIVKVYFFIRWDVVSQRLWIWGSKRQSEIMIILSSRNSNVLTSITIDFMSSLFFQDNFRNVVLFTTVYKLNWNVQLTVFRLKFKTETDWIDGQSANVPN
jgi:hypothetical protein